MINVGAPELMLILLVALLVLGPAKLPDAARQVGRAVGELRRMSSGFQAELRDAMQEPLDGMPSLKPSEILSEPKEPRRAAPRNPPQQTATAPQGDGTGDGASHVTGDGTGPAGDAPPAPDTGSNGTTPH